MNNTRNRKGIHQPFINWNWLVVEFHQSRIKCALLLLRPSSKTTQRTRTPPLCEKLIPSYFPNLAVHQLTPTDEVSVSCSVSLIRQQKKSDPEQMCSGEIGGGYSSFSDRFDKKCPFFIIRDTSAEWQAGKVRGKMVKCDRNMNYLYWCSRSSTTNPQKQIKLYSKSVKPSQSM